MATGRKIFVSSDMSTDDRLLVVAEHSETAVLLWPWVLTALDDWGRAEANARTLKARLFPGLPGITAADVDEALRLYADAGLLTLYVGGGKRYMAVEPEKWWKWQTHIRTEKRTRDESTCPPPPAAQGTAGAGQPEERRSEEGASARAREDARSDAQVREDARICTPSPSPSPSPSEIKTTSTYVLVTAVAPTTVDAGARPDPDPAVPAADGADAPPALADDAAVERPAQESPAQERPAPAKPAAESPALERPAQESPAPAATATGKRRRSRSQAPSPLDAECRAIATAAYDALASAGNRPVDKPWVGRAIGRIRQLTPEARAGVVAAVGWAAAADAPGYLRAWLTKGDFAQVVSAHRAYSSRASPSQAGEAAERAVDRFLGIGGDAG